jgi:hypothetical protein
MHMFVWRCVAIIVSLLASIPGGTISLVIVLGEVVGRAGEAVGREVEVVGREVWWRLEFLRDRLDLMLAPLTNLPDDMVSGNGAVTVNVEDDEAAGDPPPGEDEVCVSPPPYSVCQLVLLHMCYAYLYSGGFGC